MMAVHDRLRFLLSIIIFVISIFGVFSQTDTQLFLLGSEAQWNTGYVAVFFNKSSFGLCDTGFGSEEADVVCRELGFSGAAGYSSGLTALHNYGYTSSLNQYLDNVTCDGTESSILDCLYDVDPSDNCGDYFVQVGVTCALPVRRAGAAEPDESALQIQQNGRWSYLCDSSWGLSNAHTACRSMGLDYALSIPQTNTFNSSQLDNSSRISVQMECTGYEDDLGYCSNSLESQTECNSTNLATVNCTSQPKRRLGEVVRLADGEFPGEGKVEVSFFGAWHRLVRYFLTVPTSRVLCRQLGFPHLVMRDKRVRRATSEQPIYKDINCIGNESSIADCPYELQVGEFSYGITWDMTLICAAEASLPIGSNVRLVKGTTRYEGRVEVLVGNRWGTVCSDDTWDMNAADVVCRQLGYEPAIAAPAHAYFGSETRLWYLSNVVCNGRETDLSGCEFSGPEDVRCSQTGTASVICGNNYTEPEDYEIRLVGSGLESEGRLEIGYQGQWGGVCSHDSFSHNDAEVICRMLGYSLGISWRGDYGVSENPVVLSNVECSGTESHISDCDSGPPEDCSPDELVGVYCSGYKHNPQDFDVRIAAGELASHGRPEVFYNGSWSYLCFSSFNGRTLDTVCTQAGYEDSDRSLTNHGPKTVLGASPLVFDCSNASRLDECSYTLNMALSTDGCPVNGTAVVDCMVYSPPVTSNPETDRSYVIKIICISITSLAALCLLVLFLVRLMCCNAPSHTPDMGEQSNTCTSVALSSYAPVGQTDQVVGDGSEPPPPYEEVTAKLTTEL